MKQNIIVDSIESKWMHSTIVECNWTQIIVGFNWIHMNALKFETIVWVKVNGIEFIVDGVIVLGPRDHDDGFKECSTYEEHH